MIIESGIVRNPNPAATLLAPVHLVQAGGCASDNFLDFQGLQHDLLAIMAIFRF